MLIDNENALHESIGQDASPAAAERARSNGDEAPSGVLADKPAAPDQPPGGDGAPDPEVSEHRPSVDGAPQGRALAIRASENRKPKRPASERRMAANRANARKSTGPRTERGKEIVSLNALKPSPRLLGLVEWKTLGQQPGSAERLYEELMAAYRPVTPMLAVHFQDFARLHMELETSERIRDARIEHRWQQADIERRRLFHEMERDLAATPQQIYEGGLCRLEDTPAKLKQQVQTLTLLKKHLMRRDFDINYLLRMLYGKDLEPSHDRAQAICIRCRKLTSAEGASIKKRDLDSLVGLVKKEEEDAFSAYSLSLDQKTMTTSACLAGLAPSAEDRWLEMQVERLRRALDRKQWLIIGLLQQLGHPDAAAYEIRPDASERLKSKPESKPAESKFDESSEPAGALGTPPPPHIKNVKTKPISPIESVNRPLKRPKTKPNKAKIIPSPRPRARLSRVKSK